MLAHCIIKPCPNIDETDNANFLITSMTLEVFAQGNEITGLAAMNIADELVAAASDCSIQLIYDDYGKELLDEYCRSTAASSTNMSRSYQKNHLDVRHTFNVAYRAA